MTTSPPPPDGADAADDDVDANEGDGDLPLDRRRQRRIRRIAGVGCLVGVGLAVLAGLGGASGQAGAAIALLIGAASCAVAATYGVLTAVRDDLRGDGVSRARTAWIIGLFFAAAGLMAMTAGVGG